jgi:excisionase family DNA binding protein
MATSSGALLNSVDSREKPYTRLLTVREVADFLALRTETIHRLMRRPEDPLPSLMVGKHHRFDLDEVMEWARRGRQP